MLTLFGIPKPFRGHTAIIQRNAIRSWKALYPPCQVLLLGDGEGTNVLAAELGLEHIPEIRCNEYGTPLVDSAFALARQRASHRLLGYVNSDIILMDDFCRAVAQVQDRGRFVMVGHRWELKVSETLDLRTAGWAPRLRDRALRKGTLGLPLGIDYFVFPGDLELDPPPFAVGRPMWDHWMLHRANALGAPVVDATLMVMAIHQRHPPGYSLSGPEAISNSQLARDTGKDRSFTLLDADAMLTPLGLEPVPLRWGVGRDMHDGLIYRQRLADRLARELSPSLATGLLLRQYAAMLHWYQGDVKLETHRPWRSLPHFWRAHKAAPSAYGWGKLGGRFWARAKAAAFRMSSRLRAPKRGGRQRPVR